MFLQFGAICVVVLVLVGATIPSSVSAAEPPVSGQNPPEPPVSGRSIRIDNFLGFENIEDVIFAVIPKLIQLATPIVAIMVIWAAYMLLFSPANPDLIKKARLTLLWTVVGYAILLAGSGLAYIIKEILTSSAAP